MPVNGPDDPRWEWVEIPEFGSPSQWIKGRCNHLDVVPVCEKDLLGDDGPVVEHLCRTCDQQLPKEWTP
ncbi:hypothetical protein ACH4OW_26230 [Streptomyces sp. NPDC017056]|uniref:hypothetical protein n=1 Tax=Streptomyces sp. NPDC017056 TaxID=3364973 RepID=UPI003797D222